MISDFYTLGGNFFWEDVFFYQKWRIQRHYKKKTCRLLDNWDIRRFEGEFNECYKEFLKSIELYEISKQSGHMIIMLPSFFESKNVFKPLWREILKENYNVAAINYPATLKNSDSHAKQINLLLNNLEDINEVSFITKGVGAIVLDKILSHKEKWQNKLKINKVITINNPKEYSLPIKKLTKSYICKIFLGPMCAEVNNFTPSFKAPNLNIKRFNKNNIKKIIKKL
ncbi:MAG: hypothetical protein R3Y43_08530 [Alphaproteobacteria bacterium]